MDPTKLEVLLSDPKPKKHSTRFDAADPDAAIGNAYVTKVALQALGNPSKIKITIEAA